MICIPFRRTWIHPRLQWDSWCCSISSFLCSVLWPLLVFSSFFDWPLHYLSFELRLQITHLSFPSSATLLDKIHIRYMRKIPTFNIFQRQSHIIHNLNHDGCYIWGMRWWPFRWPVLTCFWEFVCLQYFNNRIYFCIRIISLL